jgi:hypothetical protein
MKIIVLIDFIVLDFNIKFMTSQINYYTIYFMVFSIDIQTQGVNIKMKAYNTCSKVEIGINGINCGLVEVCITTSPSVTSFSLGIHAISESIIVM